MQKRNAGVSPLRCAPVEMTTLFCREDDFKDEDK